MNMFAALMSEDCARASEEDRRAADMKSPKDHSTEACLKPDYARASEEDRRAGHMCPKDHSAEAGLSQKAATHEGPRPFLHAANPLLCPAGLGGLRRGKEISEAQGGYVQAQGIPWSNGIPSSGMRWRSRLASS